MNRDLVVGLIREGGGTILEDFNLEAVSASADNSGCCGDALLQW